MPKDLISPKEIFDFKEDSKSSKYDSQELLCEYKPLDYHKQDSNLDFDIQATDYIKNEKESDLMPNQFQFNPFFRKSL